MHLLIVTDAWMPQVNGVVRTLQAVTAELAAKGHRVDILSPDQFRSIPCPTYPEIRLALVRQKAVARRIEGVKPDHIHIATEGPLGVAARRWCKRQGYRFTTAYHTQFPDYVAKRTRLPKGWFWRYIRWFHGASAAVLVSTGSIARELHQNGITHTRHWGRGVDLARFRPDVPRHPAIERLPCPVQLYVGRVAIEKNIEAFLGTNHPGSKVVVGDGPALSDLKRRYPGASFLGALHGDALASAYASADVFVFPSRTDTFGLVMIEALACGTPVAAFPVAGPIDVLRGDVGSMDEDLARAIGDALAKERQACAAYGSGFSWAKSAEEFEAALVPLR
ncbi:MAG TPA: glycosyltransferase family 1 protein [Allosphingosinicella sp.]